MGRYLGPCTKLGSHRFDASDAAYVVPATLVGGVIYVTGTAAGGGGCSGHARVANSGNTPDYSNGGGSGQSFIDYPLAVTPGETLAIVLGAAGTGGAAVVQAGTGTTNGNDGGDATDTTITRSGTTIFTAHGGKGGTYASGGGGLGGASTSADTSSVLKGVDGGDNTAAAPPCGGFDPGAEGTDDTLGTYVGAGGHGGAPSGFGSGGAGGDGDDGTTSTTGTAGSDGGAGGGGGGGGEARQSSTGTATSGAGGDGGDAFLIFSYRTEG